MAGTDEDDGDFEFDPDQISELGEIAEAFIHEEVNADFFNKLDRDYLEWLVDSNELDPPDDIEAEGYEAAIEVAELILDRMDAVDH
jgi:Glu-tRNA(Gln) amidotransferase subunit E-like FAD-binding protein